MPKYFTDILISTLITNFNFKLISDLLEAAY